MLISLALLLAQPQAVAEVPFQLTDDAIIVPATVNGRNVSCLFDTGFGGSVVLNPTVDIGPTDGTMTLRDFVGEIEANTVAVKTLRLGTKNVEAKGMEAVQQDLGPLSLEYGIHCDGIMGLETLMHSIVQINFAQHKFLFLDPSTDISGWVPDNKKTFLVKLLPLGSNALEMSCDTAGGKRLLMALDTGNSFYATTNKDVLERVGLWPADKEPKFTHYSGVASGAVVDWAYHMKGASIFDIPVASSYWDVIDRPAGDAESDGTVGIQFLKHFNITFDYNRRRVWFERIDDDAGNEEPGDVGISGRSTEDGSRVIIDLVSPGSPADVAGIKVGDTLLSVNGDDLGQIGYRRLSKMMEGAVGSKVHLSVSRDGFVKRYELTRVQMANESN